MTQVCHDICLRIGVKSSRWSKPYSNGLKYCQACMIFLDSATCICVCCGGHLRTHGVLRRKLVHRY